MAGIDFAGNFVFRKSCFFIAGNKCAGNGTFFFGIKHWNSDMDQMKIKDL